MMDRTWRLLRNHHLTHPPRRRILPTTGVYDVFLLQGNQIQEPFDYPLKTTLQPVTRLVFEFFILLSRLLPELDPVEGVSLVLKPQLRPTRHRFSAVFELGPGKPPTVRQIQDLSSGFNPPPDQLDQPSTSIVTVSTTWSRCHRRVQTRFTTGKRISSNQTDGDRIRVGYAFPSSSPPDLGWVFNMLKIAVNRT